VVFLEPKRIYRAHREEVADDGAAAGARLVLHAA